MKKNVIFSIVLTALVLSVNTYAQIRNKSLDEIVTATAPLITDYTIDTLGSANIKLNPDVWNGFSPSQQRQLCDSLAAAWQGNKVQLLNGWLWVYSTKIGRISPKITGGWKFVPEE
ncbi:hypothetical protein [Candidatus Electronema sp. JC]|uniref:hypothetical protein n=1 Tax=Candidatus Electronema sp. JC TaxID=3401570 RepID=UPI003AA9987E